MVLVVLNTIRNWSGYLCISASFVVCASVLLVAGTPKASAQSAGQINYSVDTEVAAALYAASATQAALERQYSAKLRAARKEIDALRQRVDISGTTANARVEELERTLAEKEREIIVILASKDASYAQEISALDAAFTNVASTPEGLAALELFNQGDQLAAIEILDEIRRARETARRVERDRADADDARSVAYLALEARYTGKLTTQDIVQRFENVTLLDPDRYSDWMMLARLYVDAGNLNQANASLERAADLAPDRLARAAVLVESSGIALNQGNLGKAEAQLEHSKSIWDAALEKEPSNVLAAEGMVFTWSLLGTLYEEQGDLGQARRAHETAGRLISRLVEADPLNMNQRWRKSLILVDIGRVFLKQGDLSAALAQFRLALSLRESVLAEVPDDSDVLLSVSALRLRIANVDSQSGHHEEEFKSLISHRGLLSKLVGIDPGNSSWRHERAITDLKLGSYHRSQVDLVNASLSYQRSVTELEALVETDPTNTAWLRDLQRAYSADADISSATRNYPDAQKKYEQTASILEALLKLEPDNAQVEISLIEARLRTAAALMAQQRWVQADRVFDESIAALRAIIPRDPSNLDHKKRLATALETSAFSLDVQGKVEDVAERYKESVAIWRSLVEMDPSNVDHNSALAQTLGHVAEHFIRVRQFSAAKNYAEQGHAVLVSLANAEPGNVGRQRALQKSHLVLGDLAYSQHDYERAIAAYQAAQVLNRQLRKDDQGNLELFTDGNHIDTLLNSAKVDQSLKAAEEKFKAMGIK